MPAAPLRNRRAAQRRLGLVSASPSPTARSAQSRGSWTRTAWRRFARTSSPQPVARPSFASRFSRLDFAHGYLPANFLSPLGNHRRTDAYGENRLRYPLDVLDAVRRAWEGRPRCRLSITDWAPGGPVRGRGGRPRLHARRARMRPRSHGRRADGRRGTAGVPPPVPDGTQRPGPRRGACPRSSAAISRRSTTRTRSSAPAGATSASSMLALRHRARGSSRTSTRGARHHPVMSDLGRLTYPDLEELLGHGLRTVAVLPLGATEPHGPHAPLGRGHHLGRHLRAGVRPSGSPTIPRSARWFCHHFHTASPATAPASRAPFPSARDPPRARRRGRALAAQGLGRILLVNSHFEPEQVRTLQETVAELGPTARLLDLLRRRNAERLTEEFRSRSCHAGRYETSLVLAERPALVREERMAALESTMIDGRRRSPPDRPTSWQWEWIAPTAALLRRRPPRRARERTFETLADMLRGRGSSEEVAAC